jgi:imidazolonepropionase-like amidohydrolase
VTEALATATSEAATACGLNRTGRLREGYDADLLLVNGDLSQDVTALHRPELVRVVGRA